MQAGTNWSAEIRERLNQADLAVILVSPDALASDFIVEQELPALIHRQRAGEIVVETSRISSPSGPNGVTVYFISHAREDGDFAELVKVNLERKGHDGWIDTDRLLPAIDWRQEIDVTIRDSKAVIAVMSPEARASEYVTHAWAFAWGCSKKIIPLMLRETSLHPRLATLQYLDFSNRLSRPWDRLYKAL
jgi:TIR domain